MEKNMYPKVHHLPGAPDAPPSYIQSSAPEYNAIHPNEQPFLPAQVPAQPQTQVFVQTQPLPPFGPRPCMVTCPNCHKQQMSSLRHETAMKTHFIAALLCVFGLVCCACIPYCVDSCKTQNHYCASCEAYLGSYANK